MARARLPWKSTGQRHYPCRCVCCLTAQWSLDDCPKLPRLYISSSSLSHSGLESRLSGDSFSSHVKIHRLWACSIHLPFIEKVNSFCSCAPSQMSQLPETKPLGTILGQPILWKNQRSHGPRQAASQAGPALLQIPPGTRRSL